MKISGSLDFELKKVDTSYVKPFNETLTYFYFSGHYRNSSIKFYEILSLSSTICCQVFGCFRYKLPQVWPNCCAIPMQNLLSGLYSNSSIKFYEVFSQSSTIYCQFSVCFPYKLPQVWPNCFSVQKLLKQEQASVPILLSCRITFWSNLACQTANAM